MIIKGHFSDLGDRALIRQARHNTLRRQSTLQKKDESMKQQAKSWDKISYTDQGKGEPLVLINGLSRTAQQWNGFDRKLAEHFRVISFDTRGAGQSNRPCTWQMRVEDMADDVLEVLDGLAIERAHVFGISLGGMVAMAFGIHHPSRCLSLSLVNTSIGQRSFGPLRITPQALKFLAKDMLILADIHKISRRLTDLVVGVDCDESERENIARTMGQMMAEQKPDKTGVLKQILAAVRFRPKQSLRHMTIPTLIVKGTHDFFVPPINSEVLAKIIPGSRLVEIDQGGHELMYDKAEELLQLQLQWSQRVSAS